MDHLPSSIGFRADINGLRAWAVIAVVLFHYQVPGFSGGFVGVDIFFVISGFLMTTIITRGLENQLFSIGNFYLARVRRIMPALMAMVAVVLALGWFFLPTPSYESLGAASAYAVSFLSNIHYLLSSGYFDSTAHEKWLLHTWSLAVEWQFYMVFPVLLKAFWRIRPGIRPLTWLLCALTAGSFIICVFYSYTEPLFAFYMLPTRCWELSVGGLVFLVSRKISPSGLQRGLMALAGWAGVISGIFLIHSGMTWPGAWAAISVVGTGLVILSERPFWLLVRNPLFQWLGSRSYSLYLWHWPLVVGLYFSGLNGRPLWLAIIFVLSLVLAHLSYELIEGYMRQGLARLRPSRQILAFGIAGSVIVGASASVHHYRFEKRLPRAVQVAADAALDRDPRMAPCLEAASDSGSPGCIYGNDHIGVILMGDSHSDSVVTALGKGASEHGLGALFWGMESCPSLQGFRYTARTHRPTDSCAHFNRWAFDRLRHMDSSIPLVLVYRASGYLLGPNEPDRAVEARYASYYFTQKYRMRLNPALMKQFLDRIVSTTCALARHRTVYLMRPLPEIGQNVPKTLSRNILFHRGNADIRITKLSYLKRNRLVWHAQDRAARKCDVRLLNPLPYLCDSRFCYGSIHGHPLYYDDDHLSEYGNRHLMPMFRRIFSSPDEGLSRNQPTN